VYERFYAPDLLDRRSVELSPDESHHLAHVLRIRVGDEVRLFDGRGNEAQAVVAVVNRRTTVVDVTGDPQREPPPTRTVTLASAVPKGNRVRWLIEKATELGIDEWVPLQTARSVVQPRTTKLDTLRQNVITACKQCRRNRLMQIAQPCDLANLAQSHQHAMLIAADRSGMPISRITLPAAGRLLAVVGPEGGLDDDELESLHRHGATMVRLSEHVLRIETACVALAAVVGAWRGGLGNAV